MRNDILLLFITSSLVRADEYLWKNFKKEHGKSYDSKETDTYRYQIFLDNLKTIQEHNSEYQKGEVTYHMGVTPFADLTQGEFIQWLEGDGEDVVEANFRDVKSFPNLTVPDSVDWRGKSGVVFEVPDGTECKASWAYSSVGAAEGQNAIKNNQSAKLSDQQIVDCSNPKTSGCDGGSIQDAFNYMIKHGILPNSSYPWQGGTTLTCAGQNGASDDKVVKIKEVEKVSSYWEDVLLALAYVGPMATLIDATYLQHYTGGIFLSEDCRKANESTINHGLLLVGYEGRELPGYLLLRNSWGTSWGEDGYLKITKNVDFNCGVYTNVLYPTFN